MDKVTVSAQALAQVLRAMIGPDHFIRELQVTRHLPFVDNPINTLINEYNEAVRAHCTSNEVL